MRTLGWLVGAAAIGVGLGFVGALVIPRRAGDYARGYAGL